MISTKNYLVLRFPLYTSAEHFIFKEKTKNPLYSNPIGDIWSFGMVMFDWLTKFSILQNERNDVTAIISLISDIIKSKGK
ncbi:hypothetical protein HZS_7498 [Henneguya salminicola]|nr:hypothetical protein HZS_7498 [Henneguya salminicola]